MFTGIVTDLGEVKSIEKSGDTKFSFYTEYSAKEIEIGSSIACSGVCLTVIDRGFDEAKGKNWFTMQASGETLSKTILGSWEMGSKVNFERAMCIGDELGR